MTGMDTCLRKPLVVTCGLDKTIRVWNYLEKSTEICKSFPEEAMSVSFHPSGLHILVGFADKLRLMNLLMDDIRTFREFMVKSCRECQFSNGGDRFAAVNGAYIHIYDMYTCEMLASLRGEKSIYPSLYQRIQINLFAMYPFIYLFNQRSLTNYPE